MLSGLAAAVYSEQNTFLIEETGNTMDIIECWENDGKEHDKVLIFLAANADNMLTSLTDGDFGDDIDGIKFIFPTPTNSNAKWTRNLPNNLRADDCDDGYYNPCLYDLDDLDT